MTNNPDSPLAERLRNARRASMTQLDLAGALKWAPSKISKIESGRQLPTEADIIAWADGVHADLVTREAWLGMLDQARAAHQLWTDQLRAGQAVVQMGFQELVDNSTFFRFYEKVYIPLFLQTPAYSRANLTHIKNIYQPDVDLDSPAGQQDLDRAVGVRQASAARLFDPACRFEFILDEAALRTWRYSHEIWSDQLIRLTTAVDLSNVRLGILPQDRLITVFDSNSFEMYGDVVSVEASHGENRHIEHDIVDHYNKQMDDLWAEAATGADAIQLIQNARQAIPH